VQIFTPNYKTSNTFKNRCFFIKITLFYLNKYDNCVNIQNMQRMENISLNNQRMTKDDQG